MNIVQYSQTNKLIFVKNGENDCAFGKIFTAHQKNVKIKVLKSTYAADVWDTFWFEKNLQGDIVAVYDEAGTKLVSYTYDAWGSK